MAKRIKGSMKKLKKVSPIALIVTIAVSLVIMGVGSFLFIRKIKNNSASYEEQIAQLNMQQSAKLRSGYVATKEIAQGDVISESNVTFSSTIASDVDASLFIQAADFGKQAVVSIATGTPVYTFEVSTGELKDVHERECNFIVLNGNTKENDLVDVRIMFPNGEDMIICSKKVIKSPMPSIASCYLWLTEADIDLLSAAIVDANNRGATIYVTKYVDPGLTAASHVNYQPPESVITLMDSNPNIVATSELQLSTSARRLMENRIDKYLEMYPDATSGPYVTGPESSVSDGTGTGTQNTGETGSGIATTPNDSIDSATNGSGDTTSNAGTTTDAGATGNTGDSSGTTNSTTDSTSGTSNTAGTGGN